MIPSSMFDSTPHGPVLLDKVHCTGDEELLMDCSHSSIGNHFCSQFLQDGSSRVAIQCAGTYCIYFQKESIYNTCMCHCIPV